MGPWDLAALWTYRIFVRGYPTTQPDSSKETRRLPTTSLGNVNAIFSENFEEVAESRNCGPGKAITNPRDCRAAAEKLGLPLVFTIGGTTAFSWSSPYHQRNCFILTAWNVRSVRFNFDTHLPPSSVGYESAICFKGESS